MLKLEAYHICQGKMCYFCVSKDAFLGWENVMTLGHETLSKPSISSRIHSVVRSVHFVHMSDTPGHFSEMSSLKRNDFHMELIVFILICIKGTFSWFPHNSNDLGPLSAGVTKVKMFCSDQITESIEQKIVWLGM